MKRFFLISMVLVVSMALFAEEGALSGMFTIDEAGNQIAFSKGNLQYKASTDTWRFAEHQYDTVGNVSNSLISNTYDGWIDLFGWGTGNNPTKTLEGDEHYDFFHEWGEHIGAGWRTLAGDEWKYIICGRTNGDSLFALGRVDGKNGLILLPDNWTMPDNVPVFKSSQEVGMLSENGEYWGIPITTNFCIENQYTADEWQIMEAAGAVFLPMSGKRHMAEAELANNVGYYWSSTKDSDMGHDKANLLSFTINQVVSKDWLFKSYGVAVRLVYSESGQAIDQVTNNQQPTTNKVLHNGQLLILRGDKVYTLQGQEVR